MRDRRLDLHKHVTWAACLTADALPPLLSALDRCPLPAPDPTIYCLKPVARILTGQEVIAEIVRGAAPTFDDYMGRFFLAFERSYEVSRAVEEFARRAGPRIARVLGRELSPGAAMEMLVRPRPQFRGMNFKAFMAQLRDNTARLLDGTDEALVAHAQSSTR